MDPIHLPLIEKMRGCTQCELAKGRTQVVPGDYGPIGGLCFIGEAPGYNEDVQGRPFVGRSGKLLDQMLEEVGLSRSQVSVLNICKCRPPQNRTPTPEERNVCSKLWLEQQLEELKPSLVVTLGSTALKHFRKGASITRMINQVIVDDYRVYPMVHPSYVLRGGRSREDYQQDFEKLVLALKQVKDNVELADRKQPGEQRTLDDFF